VKDSYMNHLVFTVEDPRKDRYRGEVDAGVNLEYDMEHVHSWPDGTRRPAPCVGVAPDNPKKYKVFKSEAERHQARYRPVLGMSAAMPAVFGSWSDYARLCDPLIVPLSSASLNLAIALFSAAISFIIALVAITNIESQRLFTEFVVFAVIGSVVVGVVLFVIWYRGTRSINDLVLAIKQRLPPKGEQAQTRVPPAT